MIFRFFLYPDLLLNRKSEEQIQQIHFAFLPKKQQIQPESKVLLITSQIYVPYQQMEAVRTWAIPNNIYVETVGFPTEWNDSKQQGMMLAANYLQEVRSTIQAINRYLGERV